MLTDPFVLRAPSLAAHSALTGADTCSLPRTSEQGGVSVYGPTITSGIGDKLTLKISHSESNENKPMKTRRVLVRLDVTGVTDGGQEGVAFAYAVIGMPERTLVKNAANASAGDDPVTDLWLTEMLIGALAVNNSSNVLDETRIPRLLNGES